MLLGKRPRQGHPMKRTTSMTEFTLDPTQANGQYPCADQITAVNNNSRSNTAHSADPVNHYPLSTGVVEAVTLQPDQNYSGVAVPVAGMACGVPVGGGGVLHHQMQRRHSANCADNFNVNGGDTLENTPHFLRDCSLCQRRLVPGRDIYMYRGDSAFCSLECRQQQISQDLRKQKGSSLMSSSANNGARNEKAASSPNSSASVSATATAAAAI